MAMMTNRTAPSAAATAPVQNHGQRKRILFLVANFVVIALAGTALTTNEHAHFGDAVFVILLALLCTLPLLYIRSYRGKYSLMIVFLAYYFGAFGVRDLVTLASNEPLGGPAPEAFLSGGEIAILLGAVCFILGYLLIASLRSDRSPGFLSRDWSPTAMLGGGVLIWAIGFYITVIWQFGVADRFGGHTLTQFHAFLSLLRILQPLGSLILIYLFLTSRSKLVLITLIATMLADLVLGFLGDSKEIAVRAPALYLFSAVLLRESLPLTQGMVFLLVASMAFSLFSAYRNEVHSRNESRDQALSRIDSRLGAIAGKDESIGERLSGGLEYFTHRITVKGYVELIVERVGKDSPFLDGYTIEPLLYAFIPRFLAPDKGDSSMAAQLFNRKFHITEDPDTYISISQLGELYWNFGWPGVIVGMLAIGAVMGTVASALRLDTRISLPRFLLLLLTVYMLCLKFEGALAATYTLWMRAAVLLILLHLLMPKTGKRTPLNKP